MILSEPSDNPRDCATSGTGTGLKHQYSRFYAPLRLELAVSFAAGIVAVSLLDILYYPDSSLRKTAAAVENVDGSVANLVDNMLETMYDAPGIGLAATQVNVHQRVVVIDVSEENDTPLTFINPTIVSAEGTGEMQEGCLSIPGVYETVKRPSQVRVAAIDREGNPFEMDTDGILAVCLQHEIDHLNGKLFVDYLSTLKRNRIRKRMEKWIRDGADPDDLPEPPERA